MTTPRWLMGSAATLLSSAAFAGPAVPLGTQLGVTLGAVLGFPLGEAVPLGDFALLLVGSLTLLLGVLVVRRKLDRG